MSAALAAPAVREESRRVRLQQTFEIALNVQAGTGTIWRPKDLPGVQLISQEAETRSSLPGGTRAQRFRLIAIEPGRHVLAWELMRDPRTVYEIYQLNLQVDTY